MVLDVGVSYGAQEDRIEPSQRVERRVGHHLAIREVVARTPRKLRPFPLDAMPGSERIEHLDRLVDHVDADPVTLDHGNLVSAHIVLAVLQEEPLQALPLERLARVDVAARIYRNAVHGVELPGVAATLPEPPYDLQ